MTDGICRCLHERRSHRGNAGRCRWCLCQDYDDAILPAYGERLEFGKHRQPAPVAETAPAWPPLGGKP